MADPVLLGKLLASGAGSTDAMRAAGYAFPGRKGVSALLTNSRKAMEAFEAQLVKWASIIQVLPAGNIRAGIVRARLLQIVMQGADPHSIAAAKLVGQDKEVGMWEPDQQVGVQVNIAPSDWRERYDDSSK